MNIQYLRYAVEIEKTGSISKAAENLYMGQPNLSKAIKELETSLGFSIFTRTSKGTSITPQGRKFMLYAKNILQQFREIELIGKSDMDTVQNLRLAVPRSSYISEAFTAFVCDLDIDKPIDVDFNETNPLDSIQQVADRQVHLGIIRYQMEYEPYFLSFLDEKNLLHRSLWTFKYLLLFSSQHPLSALDKIHPQDLNHYIEISYGDLSVPYHENYADMHSKPDICNKHIRVYERGSQFDLLAHVPHSYMWASPMPEDVLQRNGLMQRPCLDSNTFKDVLIYPEGNRCTPLGQKFIQTLQKTIDDLSAV